jgi:hypothetical protein
VKKPATGRAAVPAKKAVPVKAAPKKPAAKKPSPGAASAHKAHLAHLAHVAHLAHLGHGAKAAPKKRQLALGAGVACRSAEAVAASLRLTGRPVSDAAVLALYQRTASDPDAGASIAATLEAAGESGLAGARLTSYGLAEMYISDRSQLLIGEVMPSEPGLHDSPTYPGLRASRAGLILGVDLPGPHARRRFRLVVVGRAVRPGLLA